MILATLGSNKLVTTLDTIMTELFTGIRPDSILGYNFHIDYFIILLYDIYMLISKNNLNNYNLGITGLI
jgi:hypothetical protein